ncbi:MAG: HEPN domain-containing protein [Armatimonadetes bacterium]|nr:HEPN domain-containing protein [Armatimonadota bacterium]
MNRDRRRTLSQAWADAGVDALDAANELRAADHLRSSVSRAYYAAYSFVAAALVVEAGITFREGRMGPDHASLAALVAEHMAAGMAPRVRAGVRRGLRALYQARLVADYNPGQLISEDQAREALQKATAVACSVRRYLE